MAQERVSMEERIWILELAPNKPEKTHPQVWLQYLRDRFRDCMEKPVEYRLRSMNEMKRGILVVSDPMPSICGGTEVWNGHGEEHQ